MSSFAIRFSADAQPILCALDELAALMPRAGLLELDCEFLAQFGELFVDGALCFDNAVRIHSDAPADGAGYVLLSFEPSELFRKFLSALRAGNGDGL